MAPCVTSKRSLGSESRSFAMNLFKGQIKAEQVFPFPEGRSALAAYHRWYAGWFPALSATEKLRGRVWTSKSQDFIGRWLVPGHHDHADMISKSGRVVPVSIEHVERKRQEASQHDHDDHRVVCFL